MMYKYPKTMHFPWSPGLQNDDRRIESLDHLRGELVVVTEKMDGENASLYRDHYHARSLDSRHHPSRDWIKAFWGEKRHEIPAEYRICGENLYAEHSIHYDSLPTYFMGFSMWLDEWCLDWDQTLEWFELIGIEPVPTLFVGRFEDFIVQRPIIEADIVSRNSEGYVCRTLNGFYMNDFQKYVAKYVRKDHIQTDVHWMQKPVVPNGLKNERSDG